MADEKTLGNSPMEQALAKMGATIATEEKTPVVDPPVDPNNNSSLKTGTEGDKNPPPPATDPPPPAKSFEERFKEEFGVDYTPEAVTTFKTPKVHEFKSAYAQKLEEYTAQGGSEEDFIITQSLDIEGMSPMDVLVYNRLMEDPEMDEELIEYEISQKYGLGKWKTKPEDYDDGVEPQEIAMLKKKFDYDCKQAKQSLLEFKNKWAVPQNNNVLTEEQKQEQQAIALRQAESWKKGSEEAVSKLAKLTIPLETDKDGNVKQSFDFVIKDDAVKGELKNFLNQLYTDENAFWKPFMNADKTFNIVKLSEAMYKLQHFDSIAKAIYNDAISKGREEVISGNYKNTNFNPNHQNANGTVNPLHKQAEEAGMIRKQ